MLPLRQRLLQVEDDFLSSIIGGSTESFLEECWTPLVQDLEHAIHSSNIDEETISLAHTTSSRIEILADVFRDLHATNEELASHVMEEVEQVFSQLTIHDNSEPTQISRLVTEYTAQVLAVEESNPVLQRPIIDPYFNSHLSPTPSLVSLSTVDDSDEDTFSAPIIGRKRRSSSTGSTQSDRTIKRLRTSPYAFCHRDIEDIHAVVPEYSDDYGSLPVLAILPEPIPIHDIPSDGASERKDCCPNPAFPSRKRRLSHGDALVVPKRSRLLPRTPRLHTVSDPLPVASMLTSAQGVGEWFKVDPGMPDTPSIFRREVEPFASFQADFFDASTGALPINSHLADQRTNAIIQLVNDDLQPTESSTVDTTSTFLSLVNYGVLPAAVAGRTCTDSVVIPVPLSDLTELLTFPLEVNSASQISLQTPDTVMPSPGVTISSSNILSPPSYQCDLPNVVAAESTEPDVISLYTTLYDADHGSVSANCGEPDLNLFMTPTFPDMVNDEDWARFLSASDRPPKISMPGPPQPCDLSTDIAHFLENLLQPMEVINVTVPDSKQVLSDKLKELEAAKEAVQRLEVEVGITAWT